MKTPEDQTAGYTGKIRLNLDGYKAKIRINPHLTPLSDLPAPASNASPASNIESFSFNGPAGDRYVELMREPSSGEILLGALIMHEKNKSGRELARLSFSETGMVLEMPDQMTMPIRTTPVRTQDAPQDIVLENNREKTHSTMIALATDLGGYHGDMDGLRHNIALTLSSALTREVAKGIDDETHGGMVAPS